MAGGDANWWNELKEHLSDGLPSRPTFEGSSVDAPAGSGIAWEAAACQLLAPSDDPRMLGRIGLYEIAGVIGRGSTGIVFKAFEPSLHRYVAIKILAPQLGHSSAARKRFAREARAAAAVTHEHIVPIYAVSEFRGLPYIVMQYVPGHSLQERIEREGPLGVVETVRIALQTARALAAAHQQGLVHRDIKPANILLNVGVEHAMVTDFGLARAGDDASLTQSGFICGTPQYMSPEQARGENAGHRSDLFSLGSVMYTMCAGHPPFRAETVLGVIRRVCDAKQRPLREVNPDVPMWLDALTAILLSKDPEERFRDAAEVASLMESELAHLQNPTTNPEPKRSWLAGTTHRPRPTRALLLGSAGMVAIAILIGIFQTVGRPTDAARQPSAAIGVEESTEWEETKISWDMTEQDGKHSMINVDKSPERFLMDVTTTAGNPHTLLINKGDSEKKYSLRVGKGPSTDGTYATSELIDNIGLAQVSVTTALGSFCVNAYGAKTWTNSSSSSSSSHSSSSSNDGSRSQSSSAKRSSVFSSGTSEYSIGYAVTPWTNKAGQPVEIRCTAHDGRRTSIEFDRETKQCAISLADDDGAIQLAIVLKPDGRLEFDGKERRLDGDRVSVTATRNSIVLKIDGEEVLFSKG